jgi:hypothetical protein
MKRAGVVSPTLLFLFFARLPYLGMTGGSNRRTIGDTAIADTHFFEGIAISLLW